MKTTRLCVFGEVLFDHFPDGRRVLGGAPFNVAWHLQAFGEAPRFISRVGADAPRGTFVVLDVEGLRTCALDELGLATCWGADAPPDSPMVGLTAVMMPILPLPSAKRNSLAGPISSES